MSAATVVYVAYGVDRIDVEWIPPDADVVIVHNDDRLPATGFGPNVRHVGDGRNIGFGAAVNRALGSVRTDRVILANPDTRLQRLHFAALCSSDPDEVVTVPLVDTDGVPNAVVNAYWSPLAFLGTARRLGRFVPRGGRARTVLAPLLGSWGNAHRDAVDLLAGSWPLVERWASGAVLSIDTDRLGAVGGFDEDYFLYYEDVDLQRRLAAAYPTMRLRMPDVAPGIHAVGGSDDGSARVAAHRRHAARVYASRQHGLPWRAVERMVGSGAEFAA